MTDRELLRQVADRQEITQQVYLYCRSMDRIDHEIGYGIWNEGAIADYGPNVYQGTGRGFIDQCLELHRRALSHSHQVTNIIIELNGDRAASESYVVSALRMMLDGKPMQITTWARYLDQWSRQNGRWGIDKRVAVRDLDEIAPCTPLSDDGIGSRDRSDPSYAVLKGARSVPGPPR
jgi:SnoaL-like domain